MVALSTRATFVKAAIASLSFLNNDSTSTLQQRQQQQEQQPSLLLSSETATTSSTLRVPPGMQDVNVTSSSNANCYEYEEYNNNDDDNEEYMYYDFASKYIRKEITQIIVQNSTDFLAGSILRLAFHDATVRSITNNPMLGGSDGSIRYELDWSENRGLSKPLEVVTNIYNGLQHELQQLQQQQQSKNTSNNCPITMISQISFADTLALAGSAAVEAAHGPNIPIRMGRKDVLKADNRFLDVPIDDERDIMRGGGGGGGGGGGIISKIREKSVQQQKSGPRSVITTSLPSAGLDSLGLRLYFKRLGLTDEEFVAISGAHDLGRHVTLLGMSKQCLKNLTRTCLEDAPILQPFIFKSKTKKEEVDTSLSNNSPTLSNTYFKTLLRWNNRDIEYGEAAFIPTDVALVIDDELRKYVITFANNEQLFFQKFVTAYYKLVDSTATSKLKF